MEIVGFLIFFGIEVLAITIISTFVVHKVIKAFKRVNEDMKGGELQ